MNITASAAITAIIIKITVMPYLTTVPGSAEIRFLIFGDISSIFKNPDSVAELKLVAHKHIIGTFFLD